MLFPQEIFDFIIDAAAAERPASTLMKAFSLVCHTFHSRARIHLFSQICLCVGTYGESYRARKFLRILKYKKNADLISHCIRSVKILIYDYYDSREPTFRILLQIMRVCENPIRAVLAKFKNAPIKELVFRAAGGGCYYEFRRFQPSAVFMMLEMCSNPNLKTLRIEKIMNFPGPYYSFIEGNSTMEILRD